MGDFRNSDDLRGHSVNSRYTTVELAELDRLRGPVPRGVYQRRAVLGTIPHVIPPINIEAWRELARVAGNLATLATAMRNGDYIEIDEIKLALSEFRLKLIANPNTDEVPK